MTPSRVVSAALLTLLGVSRAVAASPQSAFGPAIVDRTAADKVTVRTVRLEKPLRIDGRLDEEVYASLEAISDFIQQEPHEGAPATEKVGYVRRTDFRRSFGQARFSPRPKQSKRIRKLTWQGSLDYVTDAPGVAVQNREAGGLFRIDFHTSDQLMFDSCSTTRARTASPPASGSAGSTPAAANCSSSTVTGGIRSRADSPRSRTARSPSRRRASSGSDRDDQRSRIPGRERPRWSSSP